MLETLGAHSLTEGLGCRPVEPRFDVWRGLGHTAGKSAPSWDQNPGPPAFDFFLLETLPCTCQALTVG